MKKFKELFIVFGIGAIVYSLIEVMFRGFTHWTMTITGGIAFIALYIANIKIKTKSILLRAIIGGAIITVIELSVGCIVNRVFHMHVWDYSNQRMNILGQICPLFSMFWFLLSIPAAFLSAGLRKKLS